MVTIIYCRYSSDMQRPESCGDQERKVREYLLRNNIPSGEIVVYKDEAVSGTKEAREAYDLAAQVVKGNVPGRKPLCCALRSCAHVRPRSATEGQFTRVFDERRFRVGCV